MRLPDPRALRRRTSRAPARLRPTTRQAEGHLRLAYRPAIDGLRAIAVVAVVVGHVNEKWLPGGWLGVDIFFVISGFLITSLLLRERTSTGRVDLLGFWLARARRLLPALFVVLAAVLLVAVSIAAMLGVDWRLGLAGMVVLAMVVSGVVVHRRLLRDFFSLRLERARGRDPRPSQAEDRDPPAFKAGNGDHRISAASTSTGPAGPGHVRRCRR